MRAHAVSRHASWTIGAAGVLALIIALSVPSSHGRGLRASPYIPTQTLVITTQPIIDIFSFLQPVTFTATVISASDAQLLGPSSGVVLFSVSGSNAFSYVHKTVLGSAKVSRAAVSGTASLTMHKDSAGLTLLPGTYNLTAEFSGAQDGIYEPSAGSTGFRIGIDALPVQWGVGKAT